MRRFFLLAVLLALTLSCQNQEERVPAGSGEIVSEYLIPTRVVLTSGTVENAAHLTEPYVGQVSTDEPEVTVFSKGGSVLLDFGREIQGGIQIVRALDGDHRAARFRLCLGESVSEALSSVDAKGSTATNDHSVRDFEISVPWLGCVETGNSGFRFARLDLLDAGWEVPVVAVRAISKYRDLPYLGSFRCSDQRLTDIWKTGAYTVHLCMQEYLWDGIKRDRLVWLGDMHPEVMAVNTVFGDQEVVRTSLDYVRAKTPPTDWMNGMCSYSLWWIIIQDHLYQWYGDKEYLEAQHSYLKELLHTVMGQMDGCREAFEEGRFLDWPSNDQPEAIHAGLQALSVMALEAGAGLANALGDTALEEECSRVAAELTTYVPDPAGSGQAASLLALAGLLDPAEAAGVVEWNGPYGCTSFMGYYMLEAMAAAGHYIEALHLMSDYWGGMLDLGATTFWEDFNYRDGQNAARIDEVVPEGKFDIHADGGAWCYVGLRHSFCHGWASGPTSWLSRHVLGIEPVGVGFSEVRIEPQLGDLEWAEGSFPTPYGLIEVSHRRTPDGSVASEIKVPKGVKLLK